MSAPSFIMMTYNIGNGLAPVGRLQRYLQRARADIIGLQEVSPAQGEMIERSLRDLYPHRVVRAAGFAGRALLSTYPIRDVRWIPCEPDRPDLQVTLDIAGQALTVIVAHPMPPRPGRTGIVFDTATLDQIRGTAETALHARPAVLLGDFNMTIRNPAYHWLRARGLVDAFVDTGNRGGRTFPLRLGHLRSVNHRLHWMPLRPLARVDYIWHTAGITAADAWLGEDAGSDHLPVFARLSLAD